MLTCHHVSIKSRERRTKTLQLQLVGNSAFCFHSHYQAIFMRLFGLGHVMPFEAVADAYGLIEEAGDDVDQGPVLSHLEPKYKVLQIVSQHVTPIDGGTERKPALGNCMIGFTMFHATLCKTAKSCSILFAFCWCGFILYIHSKLKRSTVYKPLKRLLCLCIALSSQTGCRTQDTNMDEPDEQYDAETWKRNNCSEFSN